MSLRRLTERLFPADLLWLWVWLALGIGLLLSNRALFTTPAHEEGDDAANALSIERAKHGHELYGNYSRFRFHHPGPAFFYTYAAGEWLLLDGLKAVPARHNAHLLAGMLLQALFLAGAIGLLARQSSRPVLAALCLTAACALHFAFVPGAFVGIWPPYVLMGPLACFVVACATIAAGATAGASAGWVWMALSAGYLLHGHVAQPLFLGGLAATTACLAHLRARAEGAGSLSWLPRRRTGWAAGAIIGLFSLPLLIDACFGTDSNLYSILLHLRYSDPGTRPGWFAALQYTLSYFGYCVTQENWWFNRAAGTPADYLRQHGAPLLGWFALTLAAGFWLWRHRRTPSPRQYFLRSLALCASVMLLLALYWGKRQDDGITYFNSYFLFGLMFAVLGFCVLVALEALGAFFPEADCGETRERTGGAMQGEAPIPVHGKAQSVATEACGRRNGPGLWLGRTLAAASLAAIAWAMPKIRTAELEANARANAVAAQVPRALAADSLPQAPKLLVFEQDSWYEAVTVAATLQRAKIPFKIAEAWDFMFGSEHVLTDPRSASVANAHSWWRVEVPKAGPGPDVIGLNHEGQLRLLGIPPKLGPLPAQLPFAGPHHRRNLFPLGCDAAEEDFAWTLGGVTVLRAAAEPVDADVELRLNAGALLTHRIAEQRVVLWVDGERIGQVSVKEKDTYVWRIPRDLWNWSVRRSGIFQAAFELPDARVPALIGKSGDRRKLALQLFELQIALAPAAAAGPTSAARTPSGPP